MTGKAMRFTSNIGKTGPDSIRIGGMRIEELPIRENAIALQQIPLVADTHRQNEIDNIVRGFPNQRVPYLEGRIREAEHVIERTNALKVEYNAKINEYSAQISMCEFRDKEISRIAEDDPDGEEKIKDLRRRFPLYDIEAMRNQIEQFREAIARCEQVIVDENKSIREMTEVKTQCEMRDARLKQLGVRIK